MMNSTLHSQMGLEKDNSAGLLFVIGVIDFVEDMVINNLQ